VKAVFARRTSQFETANQAMNATFRQRAATANSGKRCRPRGQVSPVSTPSTMTLSPFRADAEWLRAADEMLPPENRN
jgi:hypothetical protein